MEKHIGIRPPQIPSQSLLTPEYYLQHYMEFLPRYIARGIPSADTMRDYRIQISQFLKWCRAASCPPLALQDFELRSYREFLITSGYKSSSIHSTLAAVRAFYDTAVHLGLLAKNPAESVQAPAGQKSDQLYRFFTIEQLKKLREAFADEQNPFLRLRNTLILYLMSVEGLRNIEVYRMNREDINPELQAILIHGKGAAGRSDPIYPCGETWHLLTSYLSICPKARKQEALTPLILSRSNRNPLGRLSRNGIRFIMNQGLKKAGLKQKGYSCHILRHSCGTNLYAATKDLRVVQETLRQKDPKTTARYAHVVKRTEERPTKDITF